MSRHKLAIQAVEESRPQIYRHQGGKRLVVKTDPVDGLLDALNSVVCWVCQGKGDVQRNAQSAERINCPKCNKEKMICQN